MGRPASHFHFQKGRHAGLAMVEHWFLYGIAGSNLPPQPFLNYIWFCLRAQDRLRLGRNRL
jgi:hypothetical protein